MWKYIAVAIATVFLGGTAIAGDQVLDKQVEVRVGQSGFAGVSGTVYSIDVQGNWSAVAFLNDQTMGEPSVGVLTEEQVARLSDLLSHDLSSATMAGIEINPKTLELRYGDFTSVVTLAAGAELAGDCKENEPGHGVQSLAAWLEAELVQR